MWNTEQLHSSPERILGKKETTKFNSFQVNFLILGEVDKKVGIQPGEKFQEDFNFGSSYLPL